MDVISNIGEIETRMPSGMEFGERLKWLGGEELVERDFVADHSAGVANFSRALAEAVGFTPAEVDEIRTAARWHDIGKLAIPDAVLRKPGRLDADELALMHEHARAGERLLGAAAPAIMKDVAAFHHERYDGHGYEKLKGEQIPLAARIVNIADVHDALIQVRDYKKGMPEEDALIIMTNDAETPGFGRRAFDPYLLRRFVAMRLEDPSFRPSAENRAALQAYSRTDPMDDVPGGWESNGGWHVKATGHRIRYSTAGNGNRKVSEMRGPSGEVLFMGGTLSADAEATAEREDAPRM